MLTASDPQALLPTIRSRLVPIRVQRVADEVVTAFLQEAGVPASPARERRVLLAEGSIGAAWWSTDGSNAPEAAAERFLAAVHAGPYQWATVALTQPPWSARGDFTAMLDAVAVKLRSRVAITPQQDPANTRRLVAALRRVEATRWDAQGNLNPQLALAVLAQDLRDLT
jgi:DNA polymerase-3 subunit delta'